MTGNTFPYNATEAIMKSQNIRKLSHSRFLSSTVLVIATLLLFGCHRGPKPDFSATPSISDTRDTYYPRELGFRWEYQTGDGSTLSHEVVARRPGYFEIQVANPNISFTQYKDDGDWILHQADRIPDRELNFRYDPPIKYLRSSLESAQDWSHEGVGMYGNKRRDEVSVGEEVEITVPAGTFKVLPVHRIMQKGDRLDTETEYWAKGIGLVKSDFKSGDYHSVLELKSFDFKHSSD